MKLKVSIVLLLVSVLCVSAPKAHAQNWLNWVWSDYSNSALLTQSGDFTLPHWWWFRPERRPSSGTMAYILLNHRPYGGATYVGCAFNPNRKVGKRFKVVKNGVTFEYFVFENVGLVAPVSLRGGTVVAQTKGPRITGGFGICGVRYFAPRIPVKVTLPF